MNLTELVNIWHKTDELPTRWAKSRSSLSGRPHELQYYGIRLKLIIIEKQETMLSGVAIEIHYITHYCITYDG